MPSDHQDNDKNTVQETKRQPGSVERHRGRLKFRGIRRRAVPVGFIRVDQALDQLGTARFPDEWGVLPSHSRLPFQLEPSGNFYRYKLVRRSNRLSLTKEKQRAGTHTIARHWKRLDQLYKRVVEELRAALERGDVTAERTTSAHDLMPINNMGLWAAQIIRIFYLGVFVERNAAGRDIEVIVLVDKASFENWLQSITGANDVSPHTLLYLPSPQPTPTDAEIATAQSTPTAEETATAADIAGRETTTNVHPLPTSLVMPDKDITNEALASLRNSPTKIHTLSRETTQAMANHAKHHEYSITWELFLFDVKLACEATGQHISRNEIDHIWDRNELKSVRQRGAPSKLAKKTFELHRPELRRIIISGIVADLRSTI